MRRFDKKYNMQKANLLAEQRYLESKGLIKESEELTEEGRTSMSEFFGEPMLWSNNNPGETFESIKKAGFEILFEGPLILGGEKQYWIFARRKTN